MLIEKLSIEKKILDLTPLATRFKIGLIHFYLKIQPKISLKQLKILTKQPKISLKQLKY